MLLLADPVDSFWVSTAAGFDGKPFKSVSQGAADMKSIALIEGAEAPTEATGEVATLFAFFKQTLGEEVAEVRASPNHNERNGNMKPDVLVLHYTGMADAQEAVRRLTTESSKVSSHYIVLEDGHIIQSVPESRRAWHAGQSSWAGETDINSCSIGIEIANPGHDHGYPEFPRRQIAAVTALCRSIFTRHRIPADRVLGHSDIAPTRKRDPGEKFPWKILHDSGIGLWVKPEPIGKGGPTFVLGETNPAVEEVQYLLAQYGYDV